MQRKKRRRGSQKYIPKKQTNCILYCITFCFFFQFFPQFDILFFCQAGKALFLSAWQKKAEQMVKGVGLPTCQDFVQAVGRGWGQGRVCTHFVDAGKAPPLTQPLTRTLEKMVKKKEKRHFYSIIA
jgi:hypothetical protein